MNELADKSLRHAQYVINHSCIPNGNGTVNGVDRVPFLMEWNVMITSLVLMRVLYD